MEQSTSRCIFQIIYIVLTENGTESTFEDDVFIMGGLTPLHIGSVDGSTNYVKQLLEHPDIDLDQKDDEGVTPLLSAVVWEHSDIVTLLCHAGADINTQNNYKGTPLYLATTSGKQALVTTIAECGDKKMKLFFVHPDNG